MRSLVTVLAACACALLVHSAAWACGGLFCSTQSAVPAPVDQSAEIIVFEVQDNTVTAHIDIQYVGTSEDFAWVIPVGSVPDVREADSDIFDSLNLVTSLRMVLPAGEPCEGQPAPATAASGGGCMPMAASPAPATEAARARDDTPHDGHSPVTVFDHRMTEHYEIHVIGAERTEDLVSWLQDNNYNVSDNMTPVMDVYNAHTTMAAAALLSADELARGRLESLAIDAQHSANLMRDTRSAADQLAPRQALPDTVFLALKLRADRNASEVVPISVTYAGQHPMIPIQLTAVAAQPLLGIQVFIVGDRPYVPANYRSALPDAREIVFDQNGRTNYLEWVARAVDQADGDLFVTEYVGELLWGSQERTLSRFYTRLSPHHMTIDPVFIPHPEAAYRVANAVDLTAHPSLFRCGELLTERLPSPCAFNYCGRGADCAEVDGAAACRCPDDTVAQPVTGPDGSAHVVCEPRANPYGVTPVAGGAGTPLDPCNAADCGEGLCVLRAGFPTCQCAEGAWAHVDGGTSITCQSAPDTVPTFGPGAGSESRALALSRSPVTDTALATGTWLPIVLALVGLVGLRRRRG